VVGIRNPQVLLGFYRRLLTRGPHLRLSFPQEDINDMWKSGKMSREIYQEIDDVIKRLMTGDPSVHIPEQMVNIVARKTEPAAQSHQSRPATLEPPRFTVRNPEPDPLEWVVNIIPIPEPDNEEVLAPFRSGNAIATLLAKAKGESVM
jgi:hypothetical protein